MKEIKFRAWDKLQEEILRVDQITFNDNTTLTNYSHILDEHNDIHNLEDIVLMQFTGLKDKNGKEIWEGDIVGDEKYRWVVIWKNCGWYADNVKFGQKIDDTWNDMEVIGNIYENPELSKEA